MTSILHVIDSDEPGGAESAFVDLATEMRLRGHRTVTVVPGNGWPKQELIRRGFDPLVVDSGGTANWKLLRTLLKVIKEERVDVIQSHLLGSNVYCALAGVISRTPVVATFHGSVDVSDDESFLFAKGLILKIGVSQFVAVSRSLRDAIHKTRLLGPAKTSIIYNGIDLTRFTTPRRNLLRRKLGLSANAVLIGSLGNLHPAKGYLDLVATSEKVLQEYPNTHFVVGGNAKPELMEAIDLEIRRRGVGENVHFLGFVVDSAAFMSELDVFLLTSRTEGLSIATIEALAAGIPVVATRCGGPEEIITDGEEGLLVEVGNANDIAKGVLRILREPTFARSLAVKGKLRSDAAFDFVKMADEYEALYCRLAGQKTSADLRKIVNEVKSENT